MCLKAYISGMPPISMLTSCLLHCQHQGVHALRSLMQGLKMHGWHSRSTRPTSDVIEGQHGV